MNRIRCLTIFIIVTNSLIADCQSSYDIFIESVRECNFLQVEKMLSDGFPINSADENGWTALHWANFTHEMDAQKFNRLLKMLMENGANVNAVDKRDRNSLIILLEPGTDQITPPPLNAIKQFIENGIDIHAPDEMGNSAYKLGINSAYPEVKNYFRSLSL